MAHQLNQILKLLKKHQSNKILVIGDIILDKYIFGEVQRVSPEAPIVVHREQKVSYSLGGAANVALNIRGLSLNADLFGRVGSDESGAKVRGLLKKHGIGDHQLVEQQRYATILKTRVLSSSQQLIRLDTEQTGEWQASDWQSSFDQIDWSQYKVVVVSDYQKGTVTKEFYDLIARQVETHSIKLIVDPKFRDFGFYQNPYLITPNKKEATIALSLNKDIDDMEIASKLVSDFGVKNALVTLGGKGMQWVGKDGESIYLPATAREVYDVSGAGDTVVASIAVGLSVGLDHQSCLILANESAGSVVAKVGTQPIEWSDLVEKSNRFSANKNTLSTKKQISLNDFCEKALPKIRNKTELGPSPKVVFTNGCFDILHAGHVEYLQKAKALGDILVVGLNHDETITRQKGEGRPINSYEDRLSVLSALGAVDYIVGFSEETPIDLIQKIAPDYLVKGSDWKEDEIVGGDFVKKSGGYVHTIELKEGR